MSDAIKETLSSPGWQEIHGKLIDKIVDCYLAYPSAGAEEKVRLDIRIQELRRLMNLPVEYDMQPAGFAEREIEEAIVSGIIRDNTRLGLHPRPWSITKGGFEAALVDATGTILCRTRWHTIADAIFARLVEESSK